ncbi:MAG: hypothetical protein AAFY41_12330 [Bacteroidota bacterium]
MFYGKWLEFSEETERIIFIRYVDLLQNPDEELNRLETKMGLKKRVFAGLISNTIGMVRQSSVFSDEKRDYYLKEKYLENYSDESFQDINALIDSKVISSLGYERKGPVLPEGVQG